MKKFELENVVCRGFDQNETFKLLKMNNNLLMCWGARNFVKIKDNALRFKVSGYLHKGYVYITLGASDTYDIHLVSTHGNHKETKEGIYYDQLSDVIDMMVETKDI